ncbi:hypothetical protein B0H10DRAFT_1990270 [Mycena sp. CBHHK59/15]|nr:hypothetical protein B0H10DRAFT_1990270 [Mycena sp. CBHHK59/15]
MKPFASLVALLPFVSIVVSSVVPAQSIFSASCKASDRVLVDTRNVTAGGHEFQISTKACSADVLALSSQSRAIEQRQTFTTCGFGGQYKCVVNQGIGPLEADCVALSNAVVAAFEAPGDSGLFTVPPQFVQELSLGTCLWAWINENPVGGATITTCYSELTGVYSFNLDQECIIPGDTGGFFIPGTTEPGIDPRVLDWVFEVLHS